MPDNQKVSEVEEENDQDTLPRGGFINPMDLIVGESGDSLDSSDKDDLEPS